VAIALAAAGTAVRQTVAGTTIDLPYPAGIAAGDCLVFYVGNAATTITLPAGYASMTGAAGSVTTTGGTTILMGCKIATGTESGNLTVTKASGVASGRMFRYTGVDTVTPQDVTAVSVAANASTNVATSITTVTAGAMDIVCAAAAGTGAMSEPTHTEEDDSGGTGFSTAYYDLLLGAAGATGTVTVTMPNSRSVSLHAALRPAASSAIALVAATTSEASGTTGITNNVPPGTADGHFLVWVTGQTTATLIAVLAGWTERQNGVSGASSLQVWYRFASSEPASYTTAARTASRAFGIMAAFSGVDATTPWDVTEAAMVAGTTAFAGPAVTPVTAGALVLGIADTLVGAGVINTVLSSSNTIPDAQVTSTNGASTNMVGGISHYPWRSGAVTPAWAASNVTTRTVAGAYALRPAAGGAPAIPPILVMSPRIGV
jgi:hypothetical protein